MNMFVKPEVSGTTVSGIININMIKEYILPPNNNTLIINKAAHVHM